MQKNLSKNILVLVGALLMIFYTTCPAHADPHTDQSSNVVIIGGSVLNTANPCGYATGAANSMSFTGGGCLPVTGPAGELGDFTFTAMHPSAITDSSLASFDTIVLNMATTALHCDTNVLTADQKTAIIDFIAAGKKLIIYDSECYPNPVNYNWLPYAFTTSNPGAFGARGTLAIIEDNTLSHNNGADPHYIDTNALSTSTDAVGDMNVMTTYDQNWCLDMSGTNANNVTGPVHTYAKYPSGTDTGLMIYNGLDQDYQTLNNPHLRKMWVQELQQPFDPSNLPCGYTVVGITLNPTSATNEINTDHTVTATLSDLLGAPQAGIVVSFSVTSGPNAGTSGTCTANADCSTDANGNVSFTYSGIGGVGIDSIDACFDDQIGSQVCSQTATKEWTLPPNVPPDCTNAHASLDELWPPNHKMKNITIQGVTDQDGDTPSIVITDIKQDEPVEGKGDGNTVPDGDGVGTDTARVRAERSGKGNGRVYVISFTADDGNGGQCQGAVEMCVPHDQRPGHTCTNDGATYSSLAP